MRDELFVARLGNFVTRHPWWVILFTLLLVGGLAAGVARLTFKSDYRVYFSEDNPQLQAFEAIQNEYNKSDNVLFVVEPRDGDVFTPRVLQAIQLLTEKAWQIPYSSRVDSITNFQHTVAEGDELVVADLVSDAQNLSAEQIRAIRNVALNEPLLVNRLVSKTGHVSGVNVTVQLPGKSNNEFAEVTDFSRKIAADIEEMYPEIKLHLTGVVMMGYAFSEQAMNDNTLLVPIMYGIVVLALLLCLRSFIATISVVILIVFSSLAALGAAGWLGWFLTSTSAVAPIIILTLVVADSVHFLVTMLHNMRVGHEKHKAIRESLRVNLQPIALTSITTAIGFLSMNFSDSPPFWDLGNIVAIGAILALLLTLTFLPALMSVLPVRAKVEKESHHPVMSVFADFVVRQRKGLLAGNLLFSLVCLSFLPLNELNDEFVKYFDQSVAFRNATDFLNENMGGIYTFEYAIRAGDSGGINEPAFLHDLQKFRDFLLQQPEVRHVNTITDTYKRLNKSMHGDDPQWYKLPDARDLAAQFLLMYEMSLPYGLDLNDQVNMDKSGTRITVTIDTMSSNEVLALERKVNNWLSSNMPDIRFDVSSTDLMFANIGKRNITSMLRGTVLALVMISFILIFAFRSIRLGLISLIPNLLPAGIAFGLWGIFYGKVGLALSVVTGITLGIVVDDTIHFISKYRRARIEMDLDRQESVRFAFSTVGMALWITSVVLVCGFIVLSFSHFTMNSEMGLMTAITIAFALILDFLLLPPLLMTLDRK
ncbi:efflux RND transporter permease subunit [Methylomarinum vadi]|uniref:efflux RND transporter permease subunit n=1 Tax=Methylomarinum vadi TaxID=438855 RepID=UPI0004DF4064|nr:MMPL family transporter [Methylomarinum vadi]